MQGLHELKVKALTLRGLIYILVLYQKSAEAIVGKKRAISLYKGKGGSLTDKLKG